MFKNALVSVSDKGGLVEFLEPLQKKYGTRIVSTGQTASLLKEKGLSVVDVHDQTGFNEVMGGRVKTLHPNIHMCLLARDNKEDQDLLKQNNLENFDLVIGNLYPFSKELNQKLDLQQQMEFVDIGGPALLRAAAKSFTRTVVLCDPKDYKLINIDKKQSVEQNKKLAAKVFHHVSEYDKLIACYLSESQSPKAESSHVLSGKVFQFSGEKVQDLRYGENPHQKAVWFHFKNESNGLHKARLVQGKQLSYNNILDIDGAVLTLREFQKNICCVSVKHNNPCGVAFGDSVSEALDLSLKADLKSVFGGVLALNNEIDEKSAQIINSMFLECVVAPSFSQKALSILSQKKNLRLLEWPTIGKECDAPLRLRSIEGGFLAQQKDNICMDWDSFDFIGEKPNEKEKQDLELAWKVCAHLKSNAIAICLNSQTLGLGMGQVNRVDAVKQAIFRAKEFHSAQNTFLASDGFFPFVDSLELICEAKIKWLIQPGGSINDEKIKSKAKSLGLNMILTKKRHFYH